MVTPEKLRRYPFFACLTLDQIGILAKAGEELSVEVGHSFFREGDELKCLFFVLDENVDITLEIPDKSVEQDIGRQILGNLINRDATVSSADPGQIFAWSALLPPHISTASATTRVPSRVIAFDCEELKLAFQEDCLFANVMLNKIAVVIRQRLRDMRIHSLAFIPA